MSTPWPVVLEGFDAGTAELVRRALLLTAERPCWICDPEAWRQ